MTNLHENIFIQQVLIHVQVIAWSTIMPSEITAQEIAEICAHVVKEMIKSQNLTPLIVEKKLYLCTQNDFQITVRETSYRRSPTMTAKSMRNCYLIAYQPSIITYLEALPPQNQWYKFLGLKQDTTENVNEFSAHLKTQAIYYANSNARAKPKKRSLKSGCAHSSVRVHGNWKFGKSLSALEWKWHRRGPSKNLLASHTLSKRRKREIRNCRSLPQKRRTKLHQIDTGTQIEDHFLNARGHGASHGHSKPNTRFRSKSRETFYQKLGMKDLCLHCGRNIHKSNEFKVNRNSLTCTSCNENGHTAWVCITTLSKNSWTNYKNRNKHTSHTRRNKTDSDNDIDYVDDDDEYPVIREITDVNKEAEGDEKYSVSIDIEGVGSRAILRLGWCRHRISTGQK